MKTMQKGFTLIELMIVVAIIAILAAIALPAYQDYTVRSKVTELVVAADACKTSVAEYFQSKSSMPNTIDAAGCSNKTTQYISTLGVAGNSATSATITVAANTAAGHLPQLAGGANFVLVGSAANSSAPISWSCTTSTIAAKYLPASCRP